MIPLRVIQRGVNKSVDRQIDKQQSGVQKRLDQGGGSGKIRTEEEESKQHTDYNQVYHQHDHARQGCFEIKIRSYAFVRLDQIQDDTAEGGSQKDATRDDIEQIPEFCHAIDEEEGQKYF